MFTAYVFVPDKYGIYHLYRSMNRVVYTHAVRYSTCVALSNAWCLNKLYHHKETHFIVHHRLRLRCLLLLLLSSSSSSRRKSPASQPASHKTNRRERAVEKYIFYGIQTNGTCNTFIIAYHIFSIFIFRYRFSWCADVSLFANVFFWGFVIPFVSSCLESMCEFRWNLCCSFQNHCNFSHPLQKIWIWLLITASPFADTHTLPKNRKT